MIAEISTQKLNHVFSLHKSNQNSPERRISSHYVKQTLSITKTFPSNRIHHIFSSQYFSLLVCSLVILNIIVLILGYSYNEESYTSYICEILQLILTIIFFIEISMKVFLLGVKNFFKNFYDVLDFLIIILNIFEIIYELSIEDNLFNPSSPSSPAIKSLKFLRLFRFIIELGYWKTGSMLFREMMSTLESTADFIVVIFIFVLLASLYGMQIFSYTVRLDGEKISKDLANGEAPRLNYDTFLESLMTTTLIFLNEEWHVIMFQYMRACGSKAAIFFVLVLFCGSILLMKMFVVLFINNFLNSKSIKKLIFKKPIWNKMAESITKKIKKITSSPQV